MGLRRQLFVLAGWQDCNCIRCGAVSYFQVGSGSCDQAKPAKIKISFDKSAALGLAYTCIPTSYYKGRSSCKKVSRAKMVLRAIFAIS